MDIIKTKKIILLLLSLMVILSSIPVIKNLLMYPNISVINLSGIEPIKLSNMKVSGSQMTVNDNASFDYELIGFRLDNDGLRSSVIVKKNNQEFVIQIGELLDNKYKLDSVSKQYMSFSYLGRKYQIENNLTQ